MITEQQRTWRTDLRRWETIFLLCGFIRIYRYTLFINGKLIKKYSLWKLQSNMAIHMNSANQLGEIVIGRQEFADRYNGNKYLIPYNIKLDITQE